MRPASALALAVALLCALPAAADERAPCRSASAVPGTLEAGDWNAPVSIWGYIDADPDAPGCQPRIPLAHAARMKEWFECDFEVQLPGEQTPPFADPCHGPQTVDACRGLRAELAAAAAKQGVPVPASIWPARFDLLSRDQAEQAARSGGLPFSCLMPARDRVGEDAVDPRDVVISELARNVPAWSWKWAWGGRELASVPARCKDATGKPIRCELHDFVDAICRNGGGASCGDAHQRVVYYTELDDGRRQAWPKAVILDGSAPECRKWKLDRVQERFERMGFSHVHLNQKLHQYQATTRYEMPAQTALSTRKSAATLAHRGATPLDWMANRTDAAWSSVAAGCPRHFGNLRPPWDGSGSDDPACRARYSAYVASLVGYSEGLRERGIPYHMHLAGFHLVPGSTRDDDPHSRADEQAAIRKLAAGASFLHLNQGTKVDRVKPEDVAAIDALYHPAVWSDPTAGLRPRATGACAAAEPAEEIELVVARILVADPGGKPELRVGENGTTSGSWSYKVWCHCPDASPGTPPSEKVCGKPSAKDSRLVDANLADVTACAFPWARAGRWRVALEVRQGGKTGSTYTDVWWP